MRSSRRSAASPSSPSTASASGAASSNASSASSPTVNSRSVRASASLEAYAAGLSRRTEGLIAADKLKRPANSSAKASGPMLTPLPPKSGSRGGEEEKSAAASQASSRSPSASGRARGKSRGGTKQPHTPHAASAFGVESFFAPASADAPPPFHRVASPRFARARHGSRPIVAAAATPEPALIKPLKPYTLTRTAATASTAAQAGSAVSKVAGAVATPAVSAESDAPSVGAPRVIRPWYLAVQESAASASSRAAASTSTTRAAHDLARCTKGWGREIKSMLASSSASFQEQSAADSLQATTLHLDVLRRGEADDMMLESLAGVFHLEARGAMKAHRQKQLVESDHATMHRLVAQRDALIDDVLARSNARKTSVLTQFARGWDMVSFLGAKIEQAGMRVVEEGNKHGNVHLSKLRAHVPGNLEAGIGLQEFPSPALAPAASPAGSTVTSPKANATATAAKPVALATAVPGAGSDDGPPAVSDFSFPLRAIGERDNPLSLRLPTSVSLTASSSGIDPATGKFDPQLVIAKEPAAALTPTPVFGLGSAAGGRGEKDRNYTTSRTDLALIHAGSTLVHTAAPSTNPSWVTLASSDPVGLLKRSAEQLTTDSFAFSGLYDELAADLVGLEHQEHVLDMIGLALANYKAVQGINTDNAVYASRHANSALAGLYAGGVGGSSPSSGAAAGGQSTSMKLADDDDSRASSPVPITPASRAALVQQRLRDLYLDLECAGFHDFLLTFRAPAPLQLPGAPVPPAPHEDDSLPSLKALCKNILTRLSQNSKYYSRFYYEVHSPSQKNVWFAGFILGAETRSVFPGGAMEARTEQTPAAAPVSPLSVLDVDFYDTTQTTLALHSDGSTFVCGHSRRVLQTLNEATVIGMIIDIMHGFIAFTVDGQNPQTIFGVGASMYQPHEQQQQAEWITSGRLRACFGLLGPRMRPANKTISAKEIERERMRIRLGLDAAGNIIPVDKSLPPTTATAPATSNNATNDSSSARPTSSATNASAELIGWIVPKLSVNLGQHEFISLPTGANLATATKQHDTEREHGGADRSRGRVTGSNAGIGACLAANAQDAPLSDSSDSEHSLMRAFTAYQTSNITKQAQRSLQQAARDKAVVSGASSGDAKHAATTAATLPLASPLPSIEGGSSSYKHRQSKEALQAIDALRAQMLARPSAVDLQRQAEDQKQQFVAALQASRLASWSHFPPHSVRVQQAVLKVQRIARRYIGFRVRRALWTKLARYAVIIQRAYRHYRFNKTRQLLRAVLPIQRLWRGYKARKLVALLKRHNLTWDSANRAAVRLQSFTRMLLARKKVLVMALVVTQKIEQIRGLVIFVQRMVRRKLEKRTVMSNKSMLSSVLIFQSRIRGIRLRRMLAAVDPNAAKQLRLIASNVSVKKKRFAAVCLLQRIYRGYRARKLVRMKREAMQQDGGN